MQTTSDLGFDPRFNRLMGGWRDIVEDTRRLAARIAELPDACDCTEGGAVCACCVTREGAFPETCHICADHVRRLAPRISHVLDDTLRYLPAVDAMTPTANLELHESFREVANGVFRLLQTIDALQLASGDFRHGCRTGHVVVLKRVAASLTEAVESAHARLRSLRQ